MGGSHKASPPVLAVAFVCGLSLGVGVSYGGMTDARKSSSFFNLTNIGTPFWDPTLGIMFATALAVNTVLYYGLRAVLKAPLLAPSFSIPTRTDTPAELFVGAAMFGAGWALGGYCPGPAIVAAWEGNPKTLLFVASMAAGMAVYKWQDVTHAAAKASRDGQEAKRFAETHPTAHSAALSAVATASALAVAYLYYEAVASGEPAHRATSTFYVHPLWPAAGGALIGLSVALMMALTGEILGISGIVSGIFSTTTRDKAFRISFVAGLVAAAAFMARVAPDAIVNRMHRPWQFFVVGGLLVGYGTSLGSGCTSGHGIAGLTRMSRRSIAAVATFMVANALVSTALHTVGIGTGWKAAMQA